MVAGPGVDRQSRGSWQASKDRCRTELTCGHQNSCSWSLYRRYGGIRGSPWHRRGRGRAAEPGGGPERVVVAAVDAKREPSCFVFRSLSHVARGGARGWKGKGSTVERRGVVVVVVVVARAGRDKPRASQGRFGRPRSARTDGEDSRRCRRRAVGGWCVGGRLRDVKEDDHVAVWREGEGEARSREGVALKAEVLERKIQVEYVVSKASRQGRSSWEHRRLQTAALGQDGKWAISLDN